MEAKLKLVDDEEEIQYQKDHKVREGVEPRKRTLFYLLIAAICVYIVCILVPNPLEIFFDPNGAYENAAGYLEEVRARFVMMEQFFDPDKVGLAHAWTLWNYILALLVGAGLAVTGAVYQGAFRNAIASPTTLGVMSGGKTAGMLYIIATSGSGVDIVQTVIVEKTGGFISLSGLILAVLAGCFAAVGFTTAVSAVAGRGKFSSVALIVTGMVFSSAAGAVDSLISLYYQRTEPYGDIAAQLRTLLGGHLNGQRLESVAIPGTVVILVLVIMILQAKKLNLLCFGEDEAKAMGVNVKRTRRTVVILSTIMTAVIIAFCGSIGFVGMAIPHIARRAVGSDFRYFLPATALIGGIFLMICNSMPSATCMSNTVVGVWTGLLGGFLFLFVIIRQRRSRNADWA